MCFWGAAGTAKSFQVMLIIVVLLTMPDIGGVRVLWCRKTRKAITQSSLVTLRKVYELLGMPWSSKPAPSHRGSETYHTSAGVNELVWCGLDNPMNLFSSEYDIIVVEEAIQVSLDTFENSVIRCLRNDAIPAQIAIALTNPGPKMSWVYQRMNRPPEGKLEPQMAGHRTTRYHNPAYYEEDGTITPRGRRYEKRLDGYTGSRRDRLKDGLWTMEEGAILDNFVEALHLYSGVFVGEKFRGAWIELTEDHSVLGERGTRIPIEWTFGSMDLGFVNAGVLHAYGVGFDGTLYLLEEVYHTQKDRDWWTERIWEFFGRYWLDSIVADHDEELHRHWNSTIGERAPGHKTRDGDPFVRKCAKSRGNKDQLKVDVVRTLLNQRPDGRPRAFFAEDARRHDPDPYLKAEAKPTCWVEEIPQLVWDPVDADKAEDKLPEEKLKDGRANHGFDTVVYAGRYARDRVDPAGWEGASPETEPGTWEHHKRHMMSRWEKDSA